MLPVLVILASPGTTVHQLTVRNINKLLLCNRPFCLKIGLRFKKNKCILQCYKHLVFFLKRIKTTSEYFVYKVYFCNLTYIDIYMNIQYVGEHIMAGTLGRLFIWISFISLVLSITLYVLSLRSKDKAALYTKLAGNAFWLHFISLLGGIGSLYYLIGNHCFEYSYVWQYSSRDMPLKYIVSCF